MNYYGVCLIFYYNAQSQTGLQIVAHLGAPTLCTEAVAFFRFQN